MIWLASGEASFVTGHTLPVDGGVRASFRDRIQLAETVNVEVISLDQALAAYRSFDAGVPGKLVIATHHSIAK